MNITIYDQPDTKFVLATPKTRQQVLAEIERIVSDEFTWIVIGYEDAMREHGLPVYDYNALVDRLTDYAIKGHDPLRADIAVNDLELKDD